jgi:hypothetical protein
VATAGPTIRVLVALAILAGGTAQAQTTPAPPPPAEQTPPASHERPPLGAWFPVEALGALPVSASVFPLLTVVPDVIGDRIDTGGLSAG